jgi:hypothetical protein
MLRIFVKNVLPIGIRHVLIMADNLLVRTVELYCQIRCRHTNNNYKTYFFIKKIIIQALFYKIEF